MIYVDGQTIKHLETIEYVIIRGEHNIWTGKMKYVIDVGQNNSSAVVTNENGKAINFNSDADILNFMYNNGWDLMQMQPHHNPTSGSQRMLLIFKKKK